MHAERAMLSPMVQSHATETPVADNLRAELARRRMPQEEIAKLLNLPRQAINRRMRGETDFRLGELQKIADHLSIPLAELVTPVRAAS